MPNMPNYSESKLSILRCIVTFDYRTVDFTGFHMILRMFTFALIGSLTNKTVPVTALDIPLGLIPRSSYRRGNEAGHQWVERLHKGSFPGLPIGVGMSPGISGWRD